MWEEKRLGDYVKVNPDSVSSKDDFDTIQYIDISSVSSGVLEAYQILNISNAPSRAKRKIKNGDTIFSTVRPNLRAYYFVKNAPTNAVVSTGFAVIRAKKNCNNRFIYYLLTENSFVDYLTNVAKGTAYPAVDTKDFLSAKISIPPIPTQQKIADILSAYDDLIENNNHRIELLEQAAQQLYKEWFVRFRFPGHEKVHFTKGLPDGWEVVKLGDEINITSSKRIFLSDYVEKGIPFYRSKEVIQMADGQAITESLFIEKAKYNEIKERFGVPIENDILLTSVGTIGISLLIKNDTPFYFKDGNLTWLQSSVKPFFALYLHLWLKSDSGKQQILGSAIGTSQSALTIENLKNNKIIRPEESVLIEFSKIIKPINLQLEKLQQKNQNLIKQRDLLLPRLMSGKLEV